MPLTSTFYDGVVTESDRAKNLAGSPEYGVYGPEDFKVTAHPSIPFAVLVKAGRAHGHGVTDTAAEDQVVQCATLSGSGTVRWDLIVVRRNWQPELGGPSTLEVVQAGVEPQIPSGRIVGPGIEDDQPIFLVKWQGGVSAPVDFRDLRVWAGNGGLYAKDDLVRKYMEKPGTDININGVSWACQLGDNDLPTWQRYSRSFAKAMGRGVLSAIPAVNPNIGPVPVAFPPGKFTVPPIVDVNSDQSRVTIVAADVTTSGFNVYATNNTTYDSAAGTFRWWAEQMTATSAVG